MKKIKLLFTLSLLIPFMSACSGSGDKYVTFHQENADDVQIKFDSTTKQEDIKAQEPDLVKKEGYIANWEDYTIEGKESSFTVNAVYSAITYYVYFKAQGVLVEQVPFTIEDIHGEHPKLADEKVPQIPAYSFSEPYWEDYTLSLQNIIVNAKYDKLKQFNVSFEANGEKIGNDITITKNDLDGYGQIRADLIPDEVKNYKVDYHDVVWNFKIDEGKDTVIRADISLHKFYTKFVDFEGEQVGELVPYTIETDWDSLNKPVAPSVIGYTSFWKQVDLSYSDDVITQISPDKTPNDYVITFDGGETQTVTFDSKYTLINRSKAKEKWFDEFDDIVSDIGIWKTPYNVSIHKENVQEDNFESELLPDFIDLSKSQNIKSASISSGDGINERNALKIEITAGDFALYINKSYLDEVFDGDTKALNFYAKSSINNNNFRHRTGGTNICYEVNSKNNLNGLTTTYKEFSFTKEMYDAHLESGDYMIYGGNPDGCSCADSIIYISSFIFDEENVLKSSMTLHSFENSSYESTYRQYVDKDGNDRTEETAHYRFAYDDGNGIKNDDFLITYTWAVSQTESSIAFGFSDTNLTDGHKSLSFVKPNGYIALFLPKVFTSALKDSNSKKFSFDMYSTCVINSTASVGNLQDGNNNYLNPPSGLQHPKDEWVTYTFNVDQITSDPNARFLIIQGSTSGTYYFDNFRIVSE